MKNLLLINRNLKIKRGDLLIASFVFIFNVGKTQTNFVYNGSFELYSTCPENSNLLTYALGWINPTTATPDYFNACSNDINYDVPYQGPYNYQLAQDSVGYAHVGVYSDGSNIHEYIQTLLIDTLKLNQLYYFKCYVNLADFSYYCIKNVSAYFTNSQITRTDYYNMSYSPTIMSNKYYCDTSNWTLFSGFFIAGGGEKYLTIGNFFDDSLTDVAVFNSASIAPWASYLIDNVQLYELSNFKIAGKDTIICKNDSIIIGPSEADDCNYSWLPSTGLNNDTIPNPLAFPDTITNYILTISGCGVTVSDTVTVFVQDCTGLEESSSVFGDYFNVFPNPTENKTTLTFNSIDANNSYFLISSIDGKILLKQILQIGVSTHEFDCSSIANGIYLVNLYVSGMLRANKKIIINK